MLMSFIAINIRTSLLGLSLCSPSVSLDDVARVAGGEMTTDSEYRLSYDLG